MLPDDAVAGGGPVTSKELTEGLQALRGDILKETRAIAAEEASRIFALKPPADWREFAWRTLLASQAFFSSGVFFIVLGAITLFVAYRILGPAHSGFTFVLVVLGVAIILYGTGTQGMGRLEGDMASIGKYHAAIAGGAGLLAFCIALGIIHYSEKMKTAFQIEQKYIRVPVITNDGSPFLDWYMWDFSIDGLGVPALRRGRYLEIIIPYLASEFGAADDSKPSPAGGEDQAAKTQAKQPPAKKLDRCLNDSAAEVSGQFARTVRVSYQLISEKTRNSDFNSKNLTSEDTKDIPISIQQANFQSVDGAFDYPKYRAALCIDIRSQTRAAADTGIAGSRVLESAPGKVEAKPTASPGIPTAGAE